ncbi:MAG: patatin-like phospholipase family protein [Bacteroidota bacterium]|nr:patatin-like phospholipase family protein [Candidatus Kapabacteria bacterium]MDW8220430.1 patatin-like phospholipase family protein [Bacteroidota bacterium]
MLVAQDFISSIQHEIDVFKRHFNLADATDLTYTTHDGETVGFIDIVIEGGGVKGIAAIGALYALEECGLRFRKIAGTSAGALNAAFLACAGASAIHHRTSLLLDILANIDFLGFADGGSDAQAVVRLLTVPNTDNPLETLLNRAKITIAILRNLNEVMVRMGLNPGRQLKHFLRREFQHLNAGRPFTVGELKAKWQRDSIRIKGQDLEQDFQVVVSDITHRRKAVFPLDLDEYVHNADIILLSDIIRASASIPFFFSPFRLQDFATGPENLKLPGDTCFMDGFIVSNFPLSIFDVSDFARPPRCPTFGLMIEDISRKYEHPKLDNFFKLGLAIFQTASQHGDKSYINSSPHNAARIIHISNRILRDNQEHFVSAIDFALSDSEKIQLFHNGVQAVLDKLASWNFHDYIRRYRR